MNSDGVLLHRLIHQRLNGAKLSTVQDLVGWMGAVQAQDFPMSKWALGVRMNGATRQAVDDALDRGEILRTHLLRPTWHLVSARDIHWMIALSAAHIRAANKARHQQLGLSEALVAQSNRILRSALEKQDFLTREALVAALEKESIPTGENRAAHLLMLAELEGILCSGPTHKNRQTYALLERRVPTQASLTREEALATLARRYFASRGPATLPDFTWWSGLTVGEARQALELVKTEFAAETISAQTVWRPVSSPGAADGAAEVHLLPAFDEWLISYKDRSATLRDHNQARTISSNGIFWPIVLVNGQTTGTWKAALQKEQLTIQVEFFPSAVRPSIDQIEAAAQRYASFLEKPLEAVKCA